MEKEPKKKIESPAASWENAVSGHPLSQDIKKWKLRIELKTKPQIFSMFYLAAPTDKLNTVIKYLSDELNIDTQNIFETSINPASADIWSNLSALKERIRSLECDKILIVARGFEALVYDARGNALGSKTGHDYDQLILERPANRLTPLRKEFEDMHKKIIVVTTIGKSLGEEAYKSAMESAMGSQFKDGIIEIK